MPGFLSPGKGMPLLLIPEYSGISEGQRVPDRSKTAHRKPLVKCFPTSYYENKVLPLFECQLCLRIDVDTGEAKWGKLPHSWNSESSLGRLKSKNINKNINCYKLYGEHMAKRNARFGEKTCHIGKFWKTSLLKLWTEGRASRWIRQQIQRLWSLKWVSSRRGENARVFSRSPCPESSESPLCCSWALVQWVLVYISQWQYH